LPGEVAFKLYDTYGFPLDLTEDALRVQGRKVDRAGFDAAMARQKAAARAAWKGSGEAAIAPVWFEIKEEFGASEFLGYATTRAEGRCVALVREGRRIERARAGEEVALVANQTPFYGESGGQIGDTGIIRTADALLEVVDTKKYLGDLVVHLCRVEQGEIRVGADLDLRVDEARRAKLRRAHSATHLLHAALRRHLGPHVAQKGSLVAPDRLRFDFSHPKPLSAEELAIVEREVNHYLRQNDAVTVRIMAREEAIASGAMALFGEKYGEEVRVVTMGREEDGRPYSVELCGGTHVARTGDIGLVRLTGESAVAAGIRRVEAVTGEAAFEQTAGEHRLLEELAELLRVGIPDLPARVASLLEDRRKLERELAETRRKLLTGAAAGPSDGIRLVGDLKLAARVVEGIPPKELRGTADALKKELGSGVVALVGVNEGKAAVVVSLTPDLVGKLDAVRLVRAGVEAVGGQGGGGRADFAQGGGPDAARAAEALAAIERALAQAHA